MIVSLEGKGRRAFSALSLRSVFLFWAKQGGAAPGMLTGERDEEVRRDVGVRWRLRLRADRPVVGGQLAAALAFACPYGRRAVAWLASDALALVCDHQLAVEPLLHLHTTAGVAAPAGARRDLPQPFLQADGVVVADRAHVVQAAHAVEVEPARPRPMGIGAIDRRDAEACVMAREVLRQHGVRLPEGARLGPAQRFHEAVLQRLPAALDAPFRLGGVGEDELDAELAQGTGDLRRFAPVGQLLGERPRLLVVADEAAVPVAVPGGRETVCAHRVAQEL